MPDAALKTPRSSKSCSEISVCRLLNRAESYLAASKVPEAHASAEFLMAAALGIKRGELRSHAEAALPKAKRLRFQGWVSQLTKRHPLSYVLGTHNFMGMELSVTPDVLIPRPETELLVETVLGDLLNIRGGEFADSFIQLRPDAVGRRYRSDRDPTHCLSSRQAVPSCFHILDIGTGSGCIALSLALRLPRAEVIATDISPAALRVASRNAARHQLQDRVSFVLADLFGEMSFARSWADMIVSNPPYIPSRRIETLEPEVRREPRLALDGGEDGLRAIRAVIGAAPKLLRPGGILALEIDEGQGRAVGALMMEAGFCDAGVRKDWGGFERVAFGRLPV